MMYQLICYVALLLSIPLFQAVDRTKFRTCQDTRFCRSHRLPQNANPIKYQVNTNAVISRPTDAVWSSKLSSDNGDDSLGISVTFLSSGAIRVKISEIGKNRWQPVDLLQEAGLETSPYEELKVTDPSVIALGIPDSQSFAALKHSKATSKSYKYQNNQI